jgi:cytochrome c
LAFEQQDIEMKKLAEASGCSLCHAVEHRKYGTDELLPIGPAWEDVAKKYKGQKDAVDRLVRIVLQGSGSQDRHWSGKVSGVTMPPNAVEISKPDAEKLVRWILSLDKTAHQ